MTTDKALDLAYENPGTCITTEDYYGIRNGFFYYDDEGNLKDEDKNILLEAEIYKRVKGSDDEEFDEWIEVDATIDEDFDKKFDDDLWEE